MIIDSDILIHASRGKAAAIDFLVDAGKDETLFVSVVSYLELQAGARDKLELQRVEKFLARFELMTLSDEISNRAIVLMRQYHLSHGLALPDALIASSAMEHAEILATNNTRDFSFIAGLKIIGFT